MPMRAVHLFTMILFICGCSDSENKTDDSYVKNDTTDKIRDVIPEIYKRWDVKSFKIFPQGYYLDSLFYDGPAYYRDEYNDTIYLKQNVKTKVYFPRSKNEKNETIGIIMEMDLSSIPSSWGFAELPDSIQNLYVEFWVDDLYATDKFLSYKCIEQYYADESPLYFHAYYGYNFTLHDNSGFYFRRMIVDYEKNIEQICKLANEYRAIEHILIPDHISKYQDFYIKKDSLILLFDHRKAPNPEFTICNEEFFIGSYSIPLEKLKPYIKSDYNFIFE